GDRRFTRCNSNDRYRLRACRLLGEHRGLLAPPVHGDAVDVTATVVPRCIEVAARSRLSRAIDLHRRPSARRTLLSTFPANHQPPTPRVRCCSSSQAGVSSIETGTLAALGKALSPSGLRGAVPSSQGTPPACGRQQGAQAAPSAACPRASRRSCRGTSTSL